MVGPLAVRCAATGREREEEEYAKVEDKAYKGDESLCTAQSFPSQLTLPTMASTSRPISRDTAYAPSTLVGSRPSTKPGTAAGESKTQSILEEHDAVAIAMCDLSHLETEPQRLQSFDGLEHVDVLGAEAAFAELSRKLSRQFTQENDDVESQGSDGTSTIFDLREVMQRVQTERSREGAKRKRVHVVWHKLTVKGIAQVDLYPP